MTYQSHGHRERLCSVLDQAVAEPIVGFGFVELSLTDHHALNFTVFDWSPINATVLMMLHFLPAI